MKNLTHNEKLRVKRWRSRESEREGSGGGHWPMAYAKKRAIRKIALSECKARKK